MIIQDSALDFSDVLIVPKRSETASRKDVDLVREFNTRSKKHIKGIPIIASNMATGNPTMLVELSKYNMFTAIRKSYNKTFWNTIETVPDDIVKYAWYTIGNSQAEVHELHNHIKRLQAAKINYYHIKIMIDVANGYSQDFVNFVKHVKNVFPDNILAAGNVCTPEMTQELILAGADYVKIGIGPGSQCETRLKTGVGYPQLSAAITCADVAHGLNAGIILDGGMTSPGDIAKAFCANADFVMLGGMFAGTDECDGELITKYYESDELNKNDDGKYQRIIEEKKYKLFYGMSSEYAQNGSMPEYATSEGKAELIDYKGPVKDVIRDILGGLRSCGTYIGAKRLKDFSKCGSFVKVSKQHNRF